MHDIFGQGLLSTLHVIGQSIAHVQALLKAFIRRPHFTPKHSLRVGVIEEAVLCSDGQMRVIPWFQVDFPLAEDDG